MSALTISPLDGAEMPSVFPAILELGKRKSLFVAEDDFWLMVELSIDRVRSEVRLKRKESLDSMKRGKRGS